MESRQDILTPRLCQSRSDVSAFIDHELKFQKAALALDFR